MINNFQVYSSSPAGMFPYSSYQNLLISPLNYPIYVINKPEMIQNFYYQDGQNENFFNLTNIFPINQLSEANNIDRYEGQKDGTIEPFHQQNIWNDQNYENSLESMENNEMKKENQGVQLIKRRGALIRNLGYERNQSELEENNNIKILRPIIHMCLSSSKKQLKGLYENTLQNREGLKQIINSFNQKLQCFRKSKQEMLKIIIRRIQKFHRTHANKRYDKKFILFGGFKSMNISYLKQLFSDQQFLKSYQAVAKNFKQQFEKQNNEKIEVFLTYCRNIGVDYERKRAILSLEKKARMPWPDIWKNKLYKVLIQLSERYGMQEESLQELS